MRVLDGGSGWLDPIVISSDNKRIAAADHKQRGIRLFDLSDDTVRKGYKHRVNDLCFYPDTNHVVLAGETDLLLHDWNTGTNDPFRKASVLRVRVTPGGELLTYEYHFGETENVVGRWVVGLGGTIDRVSERRFDARGHNYSQFWSDGSRMFVVFGSSGHKDARGVILSTADGKEVGTFISPTDWPGELLAAPNGEQFVGRFQRTIAIWDGPNWTRREIKIAGRRDLTGLAYHPSGKHLAAACNDETVRVFDTTTWEEVSKFVWESGRLRSVTYSADGTLAAAGTDTGKIIVWDVDE